MPISREVRDDRRREILSILSHAKRPIGSQQEIVEILRQQRIQATQSSVSRDLAALGQAAWPEVKGVLAEDATLFLATANHGDQKLLLHRLTNLQEQVRD